MTFIENLRRDWLSNIRGDVLSGLVVALALIPEAIAFSIIAGVDPKVGLYASFSIAVIIAFTGGRPGMISAATAATAVLMVTLVKEHGLQYLLVATIVARILQVLAGFLRFGYLMRFVSRSVMTGFVNALAILIFMAQLPELIGGAVADLRHARSGPFHHLRLSPHNEGDPVAAGLHCRANRGHAGLRPQPPDRWRHG
jgi:SulP family sulfate permease